MQENRRDFLRKSLKLGAAATAVTAVALNAKTPDNNTSGVTQGKAKKKEVLYFKSKAWEDYYKIVY
ncbi:MAG: twin-arginine translocation signal domain-containing protein [Campylobacter sp.]|nr:twin-arginine translocation signal domain-containing protein [Campylobacter sp.]